MRYLTTNGKFVKLAIVLNQKKIKVILVQQKINVGLFFNKVMASHISTITFLLALIAVTPKPEFNYRNSVRLQQMLITFNILGIYWSLQENLWGGAWDWNFIEVSIVIITCYQLLFVHKKKTLLYREMTLSTTLIIYVLYNHTPFVLGVHSFTNNKLTKYCPVLIISVIAVKAIKLKNYYITLILFLWVSQVVRFERVNHIVRTTINGSLVYRCLVSGGLNVIWALSYKTLTPLILLTYKSNKKNNLLLYHWHTKISHLILTVVAYQGSYSHGTPNKYLEINLSNIKVNQVVAFDTYSIRKIKFGLITQVGVKSINGCLSSQEKY